VTSKQIQFVIKVSEYVLLGWRLDWCKAEDCQRSELYGWHWFAWEDETPQEASGFRGRDKGQRWQDENHQRGTTN